MTKKISLIVLALLLVQLFSCSVAPKKQTKPGDKPHTEAFQKQLPEWAKNAVIYEVNIRQYTPEGTLKAFTQHLPRLKELGVDILWLMPIYPIGEQNRKGTLGSSYSVKDYMSINPEFGTPTDLTLLVQKAHALGMHVILDWVANHTAWDNNLMTLHPDWYTRDSLGNVVSPVPDWSDVADLNYENQEVWKYMYNAMNYWVQGYDIDGFRCDVAGMVPVEFWAWIIPELVKEKNLFMLAEAEQPELILAGFDMDYHWTLLHLQNEIAGGKKNAVDLRTQLLNDTGNYPAGAIRMNFITNHDENSWNGTAYERLGGAVECFTVLNFTLPGMPLIYSGQEAGLNKALEFFEKDSILWRDHPMKGLYQKLSAAKKNNQALWNGMYGGDFNLISDENDTRFFAFTRKKGKNKLVAFFNLSGDPLPIPALKINPFRQWETLVSKPETDLKAEEVHLPPWGFLVLSKTEH